MHWSEKDWQRVVLLDESPFELLNDGYHFHGILNHFKGFAVKKEAVLFPPWPERKLPSDFFSDPVTYWGHGSPPKGMGGQDRRCGLSSFSPSYRQKLTGESGYGGKIYVRIISLHPVEHSIVHYECPICVKPAVHLHTPNRLIAEFSMGACEYTLSQR